MKGFLEETGGPYVYGKWIKLHNRRVFLYRMADGSTVMIFHALRGWKNISKLRVGLTAEATECVIQMLIESQKQLKYEGQKVITR